jgi:mannosyltransferase OCH1-like enzyme
MIPKIIHQTWNDDPLPQILKYIRDENINYLKIKDMNLFCGQTK